MGQQLGAYFLMVRLKFLYVLINTQSRTYILCYAALISYNPSGCARLFLFLFHDVFHFTANK